MTAYALTSMNLPSPTNGAGLLYVLALIGAATVLPRIGRK